VGPATRARVGDAERDAVRLARARRPGQLAAAIAASRAAFADADQCSLEAAFEALHRGALLIKFALAAKGI
jgi:hypothetical protein